MTPDTEKEVLRRDRAALETALRESGAVIRGNTVRCPFHDDRSPSGSIYHKDGVWRFRCFTCDLTEDVIGVRAKVAGKGSGDVLKEMAPAEEPAVKPPRVFATVEAVLESVGGYQSVEDHYAYSDPETGRIDMLVIRCHDSKGHKCFLQGRPWPDGGFILRGPNKPWPLFNRTRVSKSETVVVVEGEKCVKALHSIGIVATTSPGGAENAGNADWSPLAGKECVLWRDNDPKGLSYMRAVADALLKLSPPARVRWVDIAPLDLPDKGDVADFIERGGDDVRGDVVRVLSGAAAAGPAARVRKLIEDTIAGRRSAVTWPWRMLGELTQALLPGTVTALCGDGGSTKTYFILQAATYWHAKQITVAVQELEEDEDGSTLLRVLEQQSTLSGLHDLEWVKDNPADAMDAYARHEDFLDSFGARLWAIPGSIPKLTDLSDWVRDRAHEGVRVILIDPITAAESGDKPWSEDKRFIRDSQTILRDFGSSLLVVTHPKQGRKGGHGPASMDDMAGGAAWQRFTQTVLWLKRHDEPKNVKCMRKLAGQPVTDNVRINRSVKIYKARNGQGAGKELGFIFGAGMLFAEQGLVVKAAAEAEEAP